jgi:hypothetical protein
MKAVIDCGMGQNPALFVLDPEIERHVPKIWRT